MSSLVEDLRRFETPWTKVGRVYRRVCFLRSEGRVEESRRIEAGELAEALLEARKECATDLDVDVRFTELKAEAETRVAEAVAYAEVLVPMLTERLRAIAGMAPSAAATPPPRRARAEATGGSLGIADFIDEMLAQDVARSH